MEGRLHKVQEDGHLKNRDDADKFNLATDDENIDFNISGVPNAMVKRSESISVHVNGIYPSTARADTSCEMAQQITRSFSSPCWISSLSRTFESGKVDQTVTGTGRKKVLENTTRQINSKRSVGTHKVRT